MRIKVIPDFGKTHTTTLASHIADNQDGRDYENDTAGAAIESADKLAETIGNLIETLTEKGILSLEESLKISGSSIHNVEKIK